MAMLVAVDAGGHDVGLSITTAVLARVEMFGGRLQPTGLGG